MQQSKKKYDAINKRRVIHRNSKEIMSILFDEMNFDEEKFIRVKKSLGLKEHHLIYNVNNPSFEIFSRFI